MAAVAISGATLPDALFLGLGRLCRCKCLSGKTGVLRSERSDT
jgi:hypothetical protein